MIALLKKDIFVMDKQMRLLVILALLFNLIPSASSLGATYAMLIALLLPMSTISYDERCKWDRYAAMLPWTPQQIVGSKYVLSYGALALGAALIILGNFARTLYGGATDWEETGALLAIYLVLIAVMTAVVYPLIYRFGSEISGDFCHGFWNGGIGDGQHGRDRGEAGGDLRPGAGGSGGSGRGRCHLPVLPAVGEVLPPPAGGRLRLIEGCSLYP